MNQDNPTPRGDDDAAPPIPPAEPPPTLEYRGAPADPADGPLGNLWRGTTGAFLAGFVVGIVATSGALLVSYLTANAAPLIVIGSSETIGLALCAPLRDRERAFAFGLLASFVFGLFTTIAGLYL